MELAAGRLRYAVRSVPGGLACHLGWFYLTTTATTTTTTRHLLQR